MSSDATWPPQRRADDTRIALIEQRMDSFENKVDENTKLTREVLDTLRAFKMIGAIAKWGTVVGGAAVGGYHGIIAFLKAIKGG